MKKASRFQLKNVRRLLKEKKLRDFEDLFVAEGEKIVRDISFKGHLMDAVFVSNTFLKSERNKEFILDLEGKGIAVFSAGDAQFDKVSSLQHSQGVLAVVKKPDASKYPLPGGENALILLCDGIQDPGNLGTIIRTSAAMEVDHVMLAGDCADVFNPKVIRASSGAALDIPISTCDAAKLDHLKEEGYYLLVSQVAEEKGRDITRIKDIPSRCIIVFGSEGRGVSGEILRKADGCFYIPVSGDVESLNVTSAVAISLYVFSRMRKGS
jgi:TrmH family RNA methyltransferase